MSRHNDNSFYRKTRRVTAYSLLLCILATAALYALTQHLPIFALRLVVSALMGVAGFFAVIYLIELLSILIAGPRYIWKLGNGLAFSENKDMKMLEQMQAEGYSLCCVNRAGFYKFELSQPEEASYSVDYLHAKPGSEEYAGYIEIFESAGWEHVCSSGDYMHWFKAPKGTTPIYTDNDSLLTKYQKMRKISVWCVVGGGLASILFFALASLFFYPAPFTPFIVFMTAGGAAGGFALAMSAGALLNHARISRLKKSHNKL